MQLTAKGQIERTNQMKGQIEMVQLMAQSVNMRSQHAQPTPAANMCSQHV